MSAETARLERAGRYVLGMMDDAERERAERDLEFDAKFRAAVVAVAERMHLFDLGKDAKRPAENWQAIAGRIAAMPHMRGVPAPPAMPPDKRPNASTTSAAREPSDPARLGRDFKRIAVAIAVSFAAGYLAGLWSAGP